ncbi:MAG: PH domain-containing protein [Pseudomonadota bacterium]
MTFIESSLSNGEHVIGTYSLHWVNKLSIAWLVVLAALPLLVLKSGQLRFTEQAIDPQSLQLGVYCICGFILLKAFVRWLAIKKTEMGATNKRVIKKTGIVTRNTEEMKITSIETVTLRQGIVGTLLNYGNLLVTGQGVSDVTLIKIKSPLRVKQSIEGIDSHEVLNQEAS